MWNSFITKALIYSLSFLFLGSLSISKTLINGIEITKTVSFYFSASIVLLAVSLYVLRLKEHHMKLSRIDILLFLWYGYFIMRFLFQETYLISYEIIISYTLLFLIYFIFKYQLNTRYRKYFLSIIIKVILISATIQLAVGYLQNYAIINSFNEYFRITGLFHNPAPFSFFLAAILPIAISVYFYSNEIFDKWLSVIVALTTICILPLTLIRISWIAGLIGIFVVLNYKYNLLIKASELCNTYIKKMVAVVVFILLVTITVIALIDLKPDSAFGRLFVWKLSLNVLNENKFFGVGLGRFPVHYLNEQASYFEADKATNYEEKVADVVRYAYSDFLQVTCETGIVGAIFLLFFIFLTLFACIKALEREKQKYYDYLIAGNLGATLSIVFMASFSYPANLPSIQIIIVFILAFVSSLDTLFTVRFKRVILVFVFCLGLTFSLLSFLSGIKLYYTHMIWHKALSDQKIGLYHESIEKYELIYPYTNTNGAFLANMGICLFKLKEYEKAINILNQAENYLCDPVIYTTMGECYKALKRFNEAERSYLYAHNIVPAKFQPKYLLFHLYRDIGRKNDAKKVALELVNKKSKIESFRIMKIRNEMKKRLEEMK